MASTRYDPADYVPDVRDGLNRRERLVLRVVAAAQKEFAGRQIPTVTLYGRVLEHLDLSVDEFDSILEGFGVDWWPRALASGEP